MGCRGGKRPSIQAEVIRVAEQSQCLATPLAAVLTEPPRRNRPHGNRGAGTGRTETAAPEPAARKPPRRNRPHGNRRAGTGRTENHRAGPGYKETAAPEATRKPASGNRLQETGFRQSVASGPVALNRPHRDRSLQTVVPDPAHTKTATHQDTVTSSRSADVTRS
ncbi:hypothetical protein GCM10023193_58430 [Planotetraspora kaengkrachanensis]